MPKASTPARPRRRARIWSFVVALVIGVAAVLISGVVALGRSSCESSFQRWLTTCVAACQPGPTPAGFNLEQIAQGWDAGVEEANGALVLCPVYCKGRPPAPKAQAAVRQVRCGDASLLVGTVVGMESEFVASCRDREIVTLRDVRLSSQPRSSEVEDSQLCPHAEDH